MCLLLISQIRKLCTGSSNSRCDDVGSIYTLQGLWSQNAHNKRYLHWLLDLVKSNIPSSTSSFLKIGRISLEISFQNISAYEFWKPVASMTSDLKHHSPTASTALVTSTASFHQKMFPSTLVSKWHILVSQCLANEHTDTFYFALFEFKYAVNAT